MSSGTSCTTSAWRSGGATGPWRRSGCWGGSMATPGRCASPIRSLLVFAGLPAPESNVGAPAADDMTRIGDLVYRQWGVVIAYEGEHHQLDRAQYVKDIDRYASLRRDAVPY